MKVWLLGAEQPTNARLLKEAGAQHVGLSFHSLYPRLPKRKQWLVSERLEGEVYLASGGHMVAKKKPEQQTAVYEAFMDFVELNQDHLSLVTEWDAPMKPEDRYTHRLYMRAMLGDRFVPVWQGPGDFSPQEFKVAGVSSEQLKDHRVLSLLQQFHNRYGTSWHLLDAADTAELGTGRYASAATTAWLSPMRYGETIVWDGNKLVRYNTAMKGQARVRHRTTFARAGFDADLIEGDNHEELTRFTIWSYSQLEKHLNINNPFDPFAKDEDLSTVEVWQETVGSVEKLPNDVDKSPVVTRNAATPPVARSGPKRLIPGTSLVEKEVLETDDQGNKVFRTRQELRRSGETLRQCDSCHVAATCPAFQPGAECAYAFPVEVRTKDQMLAVMDSLIEQQAERAAFMAFQEQLNGGYADPNTSTEMTRFFDMVERRKKFTEDVALFKFQAEARGSGGLMRQMFGEDAQKIRELDIPMTSNQIIDGFLDS